jgi:hypothetical protein
VLIAVGIVLAIFGIFTSSAFGTIFSASGLFAGSLLVIFGFLSQVGLLSVEWRSINGVGTVFLCVIVCFFVLAAVSLVFQEVSYVRTARAVFHGNFLPCSVAYVHTNLRFVYLFASQYEGCYGGCASFQLLPRIPAMECRCRLGW